MPRRLISLALPSLALPLIALLASCAEPENAPPPPPSDAATSAIIADPGVDKVALARAIDGVFDTETVGRTQALLVMRGGSVIAERYAEGYDKDTRFLGWSMAKCVTAILVGQLVSDGRLRLDRTAPVPAWQRTGDPRGEITLRHLLQMRSGLRHREGGEPIFSADTPRMLFLEGRDDTARYAEAQPLEAEPGEVFNYSTPSTMILADLAAEALTERDDPQARRAVVSDYLQTRFFGPAGMDSAVAEYDAAGTMLGSSYVHATARDWAKLGEFLRNKGSVRGNQVIPRRWIDFMLTPSPAEDAYGAQVWLNRKRSTDRPQVLFPERAPDTAFACLGHMGQYVLGSPEQKLTVVRLGASSPEQQEQLRHRMGDLVSLFPVW